jgi:hypothetical protein
MQVHGWAGKAWPGGRQLIILIMIMIITTTERRDSFVSEASKEV